jgi:hypothetical protein
MRRKKREAPSSNFTGADSCLLLKAKERMLRSFSDAQEGFSEELSLDSIDSRKFIMICKD